MIEKCIYEHHYHSLTLTLLLPLAQLLVLSLCSLLMSMAEIMIWTFGIKYVGVN